MEALFDLRENLINEKKELEENAKHLHFMIKITGDKKYTEEYENMISRMKIISRRLSELYGEIESAPGYFKFRIIKLIQRRDEKTLIEEFKDLLRSSEYNSKSIDKLSTFIETLMENANRQFIVDIIKKSNITDNYYIPKNIKTYIRMASLLRNETFYDLLIEAFGFDYILDEMPNNGGEEFMDYIMENYDMRKYLSKISVLKYLWRLRYFPFSGFVGFSNFFYFF